MKNAEEKPEIDPAFADLNKRRGEMTREAWIKNVMRIYPNKTREEVEDLHNKIFPRTVNILSIVD